MPGLSTAQSMIPGLAANPAWQGYTDPFSGSGGPSVNYNPVSTGTQQATAFNLGNLGQIGAIGETVNALNRQAQQQANAGRIPNEAALETQSSANIGSELRGNLPGDVLRQLQQQAAERGVSTGTAGSPNANAAYLRALGLTSLDMTGRGQGELSAATARNPAAPIFDPTTMLLTPYQGASLGLQQSGLQLQGLSEADRTALEQEQLALEAARIGGGGGGGGGYYPTTGTGTSPGPIDYGAPPVTGSALVDPTASWLQSIGYGSGAPLVTPSAGIPSDQMSFQQLSGGYTGDIPSSNQLPAYA